MITQKEEPGTARLTASRRREWTRLDKEARHEIAGFLLDVAAFTQEIDENDDPAPVLQTMQAEIRQLERQMQQRLFALYRFYHSEIDSGDWVPKAFHQNPFDIPVQAIIEADRFVSEPVHLSELEGLSIINGLHYAT